MSPIMAQLTRNMNPIQVLLSTSLGCI